MHGQRCRFFLVDLAAGSGEEASLFTSQGARGGWRNNFLVPVRPKSEIRGNPPDQVLLAETGTRGPAGPGLPIA